MKYVNGRTGPPWEFNLRDVFRWYEVMILEQPVLSSVELEDNSTDPGSDAGSDGCASRGCWILCTVARAYASRLVGVSRGVHGSRSCFNY